MDEDLGRLLRAVLDEPVVIRVRHELGEAQSRLLERLGASYVVDAAAPRCDRFCGREECAVSAVTVRRWCRMYGCAEEPAEGSEFCSGHQHAAGETNGRVLLDRMDAGEPLAAEIGVEESGPAQPAPSPEGEPDAAGGGARYRTPVKWTRERCIAVVREVGEKVGHTPTHAEMKEAGYQSVAVNTTLHRIGFTWAELVREAGFEPNTRGIGGPETSGQAARPAPAARKGNTAASPAESEREPEATDPAEAEVAPSRRALLAADGATSRSEDHLLVKPEEMPPFQRALIRGVIAGMRAAADALEQELS